MRLIGVCGRSGSGKGLFCKLASENGIKIIDCDKVYKDLVSKLSPCLSEIADAFGAEAVKDNKLNRRYLAPIVFNDKPKLALLNSITLVHIKNEINNILSQCNDSDIVFLDAPTLFESGIDSQCDSVIGIIASDDICASRITKRDGIPLSEAYARLSNQLPESFIKENCNIVIYNTSTEADFALKALEVISNIKEGSL